MYRESREKLVEKNIKWREEYTDKTKFLKDQFDDTVGPGSYFRFEGLAPDGDSYYCIIGPAKVHAPRAKFFAGVRKLPATYSAGGKYFDSLDSAAKYAKETWGVPTPSSLKPYTSRQLEGISQKITTWKENRDKQDERKDRIESFNIDTLIREAMAVYKVNRTDYNFQTYESIVNGKVQDFENLRKDNPSFNGVLNEISTEKRQRYSYYARKYGFNETQMKNIFRTYVGFSRHHGLYAIYIGPYMLAPIHFHRFYKGLRYLGLLNDKNGNTMEIGEDIPDDTLKYILNKDSNSIREKIIQKAYEEEYKNEIDIKGEEQAKKIANKKSIAIAKDIGDMKTLASLYYADASGKFDVYQRPYQLPEKSRGERELEKHTKTQGLSMFQKTKDLEEEQNLEEQNLEEQNLEEQNLEEEQKENLKMKGIDNFNNLVKKFLPENYEPKEYDNDQQIENIRTIGKPLIQKMGLEDYSYLFNWRQLFNSPEGEGGFSFFKNVAFGPKRKDNRYMPRKVTLPSNYTEDPLCQIYSLSNYEKARIDDMIISGSGTKVFLNRNGIKKVYANVMAMFPEYNEHLLTYIKNEWGGIVNGNIVEKRPHGTYGGFVNPNGFDITRDVGTFMHFLTGIGGSLTKQDIEHINKWEKGNDITINGTLNIDNMSLKGNGELSEKCGYSIFVALSNKIASFYDKFLTNEAKNVNKIIKEKLDENPENIEGIDLSAEQNILDKHKVISGLLGLRSTRNAFLDPKAAKINSAQHINSKVKNELKLLSEISAFMAKKNIEVVSDEKIKMVVDFLNNGGDQSISQAVTRERRTNKVNELNEHINLFEPNNIKPLMVKILGDIILQKVSAFMKLNKINSINEKSISEVINFLNETGFKDCFGKSGTSSIMKNAFYLFKKQEYFYFLGKFMEENNITTIDSINENTVNKAINSLEENGFINQFTPNFINNLMIRFINLSQMNKPKVIKKLEPTNIKDISLRIHHDAKEMENIYNSQRRNIDIKESKVKKDGENKENDEKDDDGFSNINLIWDKESNKFRSYGAHNDFRSAFYEIRDITETMSYLNIEKSEKVIDPVSGAMLIPLNEDGLPDVIRVPPIFQNPPSENITSKQLQFSFSQRTKEQKIKHRTNRSDREMYELFMHTYGERAMIDINYKELKHQFENNEIDNYILQQIEESEEVDIEENDVEDPFEDEFDLEGKFEINELEERVIEPEADDVEKPEELMEQQPQFGNFQFDQENPFDVEIEDPFADMEEDKKKEKNNPILGTVNALENIVKLSQELDNEGKSAESLKLLRLAKKFSNDLRKGK